MNGLTSETAAARLDEYGPNEIRREKQVSPWSIFAGQFKGAVFWLLVGASLVAGALREWFDSLAILSIVILNAIIGFFQEYRAERALAALRAMTAPRARVIRDGRMEVIPARDVVPGDLLTLEAGDVIAADARLVESHSLSVNEAPLTGESVPVEKSAVPDEGEESRGAVFMGTTVVRGTALAEVVNTGMGTEFGKIAGLLATAREEETPLQRRLARVSQYLLYLCGGIVAVVALVGYLHGIPGVEIMLSSVSLAVAAVPEGLMAVVTIALAIGVQRMAKQHALVRRLPAVETLGCATVICTDKTGTLTQGIMRVREMRAEDEFRLLFAAAACCDAELHEAEDEGVGDPTEIAILIEARKRGIERPSIEAEYPRVAVNPFDSERKMMSVLRGDGVLYVKGALESILERCIDSPTGVTKSASEMASRGLRVLAVATGRRADEESLSLLGLIGMADPPRPESMPSVEVARNAGIKVVMITGDHPVTALAIAREIGIVRDGDDPDELVHARTSPEGKLKIVRGWKERGEVVAMTGDGVNDAPALRESHIGISMGMAGTEVAREASDIMLADDNFATIVSAVREGRNIYDNIRKSLVYLLSGNIAELMVMLGASILGYPVPLLPVHLLWINLVTDGLPALALAADPAGKDLMKMPPRPVREPILGRAQWESILFTATLQALLVLTIFIYEYENSDLPNARNHAFSLLVFAELLRAFASRSPVRLFWEEGVFTNLKLVTVVIGTVLMQVAIHHWPLAQIYFKIQEITWAECFLSLGLGMIPLLILEATKLLKRIGVSNESLGNQREG